MAGYEVMARRYRPGHFNEVVGQDPVVHTLQNALAAGRIAHAYLFCGGHGCGKTSLARIFAKALMCQRPDGHDRPTPDPCGVCPACRDIAEDRDADVVEIDAASNRGVENIRQLREQANYVPTRDRFKIYIVDEVHMLSTEAFNALLKTLEEPPAHVKFILATTDPHLIPDTILSRCQRFDFRLVPPDVLARHFADLAARENADIEPEALEAVASFAGGSVRDGLVLLDQLISFSDGRITREAVERLRGVAGAETVAGVFEAFADRSLARAFAWVDGVNARGGNTGDFLDQLVDFGRALLRRVAAGPTEARAAGGVYGPAREALESLASRVPVDTALLWLDVLAQARMRVRQRALSNPAVALDMAVARIAGLDDPRPIGELTRRLEALARGAPPPAPLPVAAIAPVVPTATVATTSSTVSAPPAPEPTAKPSSLPPPPESTASVVPMPSDSAHSTASASAPGHPPAPSSVDDARVIPSDAGRSVDAAPPPRVPPWEDAPPSPANPPSPPNGPSPHHESPPLTESPRVDESVPSPSTPPPPTPLPAPAPASATVSASRTAPPSPDAESKIAPESNVHAEAEASDPGDTPSPAPTARPRTRTRPTPATPPSDPSPASGRDGARARAAPSDPSAREGQGRFGPTLFAGAPEDGADEDDALSTPSPDTEADDRDGEAFDEEAREAMRLREEAHQQAMEAAHSDPGLRRIMDAFQARLVDLR